MLPGMTQLFSLLKVEELVKQKSFDVIVIDMPASGEALRYLYFPKLVGSIGRKMAGLLGMFGGVARMFQALSKNPIPSKGNIQIEADLLNRIQYLSEIIQNSNMTSIRLVANPDTFSMKMQKELYVCLSLWYQCRLAIINKIMPHQTTDQY